MRTEEIATNTSQYAFTYAYYIKKLAQEPQFVLDFSHLTINLMATTDGLEYLMFLHRFNKLI